MTGSQRLPVLPLFESFDECKEPRETDIIGTVPAWLQGEVSRIGPGKFEFGSDQCKHWFDGLAIVHRFAINNSKITFQSRYIESEAYLSNTQHQRITMSEFGTVATPDPCASKFSRFKAHFKPPSRSDNVNVNLFKHGDVVLANSDGPWMQILDQNLATIGKVSANDMEKYISVQLCSSHPHTDSEGNVYLAGTSFKGRPAYHVIQIPAPATKEMHSAEAILGGAKIISTVQAERALSPSYTHSFGMTEHYFIYCETPVKMNAIKAVVNTVRGKPLNNIFNYNPADMCTFHILHRDTGKPFSTTKYQVKGLFFWHIINCYEDKNHIVIDLCMLKDFKNSDLFTQPLENFRNGTFVEDKTFNNYKHHPVRVVLPLKPSLLTRVNLGENLVALQDTTCKAYYSDKDIITIEPERLLPEGQDRIDMPVINYDLFNGKKYRYFYGTGLFVNQFFMNGLGKADVQTRGCVRWQGTCDQYPSEPIFVADPNGTEEDDGIILSSVCDVNPEKQDFLLILDAKSFQEIARAHVPHDVRVPYSFHGCYSRS